MDRTAQQAVINQFVGGEANNPKLQEVLGLLDSFGAMPRSASVQGVPNNPSAEGGYDPITHRIFLSPRTPDPRRANTALHEYTHALDNVMLHQAQKIRPSSRLAFGAFDESYSPEAKRFAEGYAKMTNIPEYQPKGLGLRQQVFAQDGLSTQGLSRYRRDQSEQRAHGVSESQGGASTYPGTSHLDATRATEFDILMDLLGRSKQQKGK